MFSPAHSVRPTRALLRSLNFLAYLPPYPGKRKSCMFFTEERRVESSRIHRKQLNEIIYFQYVNHVPGPQLDGQHLGSFWSPIILVFGKIEGPENMNDEAFYRGHCPCCS